MTTARTLEGRRRPHIIPFPGVNLTLNEFRATEARREESRMNRRCGLRLWRPTQRVSWQVPIEAGPGEALPEGYPDFRPLLQRDGLILLGWAKRHREKGPARWTVYWVTSIGTNRYYASRDLEEKDLPQARPDYKSCGFDDGIEYYGQPAPEYIVHTAPELIERNDWQCRDPRKDHVQKLLAQGVQVNFNYRYLLTAERKKAIQRRKVENNRRIASGMGKE
jgi:hypothetical protein